ncbi:hypothetical protein WR25_22879 [Diploscapter pachys]|uniref:Uncharacterized protein n=1 Tax=Diploscapter pachys TaxID=2018661 RepID=A0A2A2KAM2_9BILA|nr:hypothetical protein WR25_22879 [Diploscapter pachys]
MVASGPLNRRARLCAGGYGISDCCSSIIRDGAPLRHLPAGNRCHVAVQAIVTSLEVGQLGAQGVAVIHQQTIGCYKMRFLLAQPLNLARIGVGVERLYHSTLAITLESPGGSLERDQIPSSARVRLEAPRHRLALVLGWLASSPRFDGSPGWAVFWPVAFDH